MDRLPKVIFNIILNQINPTNLALTNKYYYERVYKTSFTYRIMRDNKNIYRAADKVVDSDNYLYILLFISQFGYKIGNYIYIRSFRTSIKTFSKLHDKIINFTGVASSGIKNIKCDKVLFAETGFIFTIENLKYFIANSCGRKLMFSITVFTTDNMQEIKILDHLFDDNSCFEVISNVIRYDPTLQPYTYPLSELEIVSGRCMIYNDKYSIITASSTIEIFEHHKKRLPDRIFINYTIINAGNLDLIKYLLKKKYFTEATLYVALCTAIETDYEEKFRIILDYLCEDVKTIEDMPTVVFAIMLYADLKNRFKYTKMIYNNYFPEKEQPSKKRKIN